MDTTAVSSLNPILSNAPGTKSAAGNAIKPATGPDFDALEGAVKTEQGAIEAKAGRALQIFRQAVTAASPAKSGVEGAYQSVLSSEDVATAALNVARRSVAQDADVSSLALMRFRQRVQSAASVARQVGGDDPDIGRLDSAIGRIESGLRSLDGEASRNVESSASVLSVDSRERQRSSIRIRTQEGDIVRLDLSSRSRVRAQDVAVADENGSASQTDVSVSSRSRLRLRVAGDLSESEYAAIKNVFAQAESIAGEFFDGDLAAAFSLASSLNYDSDQLARVNLRFRSQQVTSTRYTESITRSAPANPAVSADSADKPQTAGGVADDVVAASQPQAVARPDAGRPAPARLVSKPTAAPVSDSTRSTPATITAAAQRAERQTLSAEVGNSAPADAAPGIDLNSSDFLQFFDMLGDFLRSVADGFDRLAESLGADLAVGAGEEASDSSDAATANAGAYTYHFSQAFKLEIFKSVLQVTAPDDAASEASTLAASLIDGIEDASVTATAEA